MPPKTRTPKPEPRVSLAHRLRTSDYFTLGFGTMVGAAWLLPIGYVYGRMVMAMPDAASEIAYTGAVFAPGVSFATGWMMVLAYLPVCPWEAVAVGKIAAYLF